VLTVVVATFFVVALIGVPLAFSFGLASLAGLAWARMPYDLMAEKMVFAVDSFPLMAIPFFMLAGELMVEGGIIQRLVALANAIVGNVRGGLAHSSVVSGVGMATVSGTAVADAAALNSALGPPMSAAYGMPFSAAVIASAANLGPIIPPSTPMILYAMLAGTQVQVSQLFAAGVLPGLLIALLMMATISVIARRRNYPRTGEPFRWALVFARLRESFLVLAMPVIVIGGIVFGVFTATEGGAIAVTYSLLAGFFLTRRLKVAALPGILLRATVTTSVVGALLAFSAPATFLFSISGLPDLVGGVLASLTDNGTVFLLLVFVLLVLVGIFIEPASAFVLLVPVLAPLAPKFGVDPLHFAVVFIITLLIGMLTPPVGALLFVMTGATRVSLGALSRELVPFVAIQFAVVVIIIFVPAIATWLPGVMRQ
jgi:tripartite ATP-independent transporter DctM subunit